MLLTYDDVGLASAYDPPMAFTGADHTTYSYNLDRQLTSVLRPDGTTVTLNYDTAGRRSTVAFSRGTIGYGYSATTGQLTTITAPGSETLSFVYDGFLLVKTTWGGTVVGNVEAVYDNDFTVAARKVNGATVAAITRDGDLLLTGAGGLMLTRDPDNGLLLGTALGSMTTARSWTLFGELETFSASYGTTGLLSFDYTRDELGRITALVETAGATSTTWGFDYDLAGRLVEVTTEQTCAGDWL